MSKYQLSYQIGDLVFFKKIFALAQPIMTYSVDSPVIEHLSELSINCQSLPVMHLNIQVELKDRFAGMHYLKGSIAYVRYIYPNYAINLSKFHSFSDYLNKFSAKTRSTLKRKLQKAKALGFHHKIYHSLSDVDEFQLHACKVGEQTYQNKLLNASIPNSQRFKKNMMELANKGHFIGGILFKNNEPCAYLYNPIKGNTYQYTYLGFINHYAQFSPGTVLQLHMLDYLTTNKNHINFYDFTEGEGEHKKLFSNKMTYRCNCLFLKKTIKNIFWVKLHICFDLLSNTTGRILTTVNLKKKIKKMIRRY